MSDTKTDSVLHLLSSLGEAKDSAEAEDSSAALPRLLRYALWADEGRDNLPERLLAEIVALAPDQQAAALAWAQDPCESAPDFAHKLDLVSAHSDRPLLRQLADCVRIIGLQHTNDNLASQQRVVLSLAHALDARDLRVYASDHRAVLHRILIGWSLVAAGASRTTGGLTCEMASDVVERWLGPILARTLSEERDRIAEEARLAEERAKEEVAEKTDRAVDESGLLDKTEAGPRHFVRVCDRSSLDAKPSPKTKEVFEPHRAIVGVDVPLVPVPDLPKIRADLVFEFPYASAEIDRLLGDLVNRATVHLKPTILLGSPGSGKSRLVRRIAETLNVPLWRTDATQSDSATFGGTARRWYSTEPCHPFLAISRGGVANPLVLIDELEKSGTRQDYGRLWDALLGFLEPETAGRYPDPALQCDLDVSQVSYIATANSLDALPSPLVDRFRIIRFPEPRADDLGSLLPALIADLARERGLAPAWIAPLTVEERNVLAAHWHGGSIRRLRTLLAALLDSRDREAQRQ